MDNKHDNSWLEGFQKAPLAMALLLLGMLFGAGVGIWLLVMLLGFDQTPSFIAGPVIAGTAIAGGLGSVLIAALIGCLLNLLRQLCRRDKRK